MNLFAALPELHSFGLVGVSGWGFRWNGGAGVAVVGALRGLFVFGGVVGGACRLVWVVVVRWSLRRPVWMRLRMV